MTPERWQQVEEVLQASLDLAPEERARFLKSRCHDDEELARETRALIDAFDAAGDFIEEPAIAQDAWVFTDQREQIRMGRAIGPYEIIERLGGGGMGEVYLARDPRLDRLVALKILRDYFVSEHTLIHRFQAEARVASALNHLNILTIYDAGQFEDISYIAA